MEFRLNKSKLSEFYDYPAFKMTRQIEAFQQEDALWEPKATYQVPNKNYIFGLEVEVENIKYDLIEQQEYKSYWTTTTDGSLRNNGVEFVSLPIKAYQIEYALDQLKQKLKKNTPDFSERTSCHVHMNVRDLTVDQILALVLVYTSVEPLLFKWVGHGRDKNIFCIPLNNTQFYTLYRLIVDQPTQAARYWLKYSALNLIPISKYGTVEFRHMYGTMDKQVLLPWICMLSKLKSFVKKTPLQEVTQTISNLNINSLYDQWVMTIFGPVYGKELLAQTNNLQQDLEESIMYCKLAALSY